MSTTNTPTEEFFEITNPKHLKLEIKLQFDAEKKELIFSAYNVIDNVQVYKRYCFFQNPEAVKLFNLDDEISNAIKSIPEHKNFGA